LKRLEAAETGMRYHLRHVLLQQAMIWGKPLFRQTRALER
jgi:hypothetical protein